MKLTDIDLNQFADKVRPLLEELDGDPTVRLSGLLTAAVLAHPISSEDFDVAVIASRRLIAAYTHGRIKDERPTIN